MSIRGEIAGLWRHLRAALTCAERSPAQIAFFHLLLLLGLATLLGSAAQARAPAGEQDRPAIATSELPPEARTVLHQIEVGGPFRYSKDGAVFGNRERRLPAQPYGYYREYTVPTPGARDRGPRRIIAGRKGELYYTDDHYRRFKRIVE